MAIEEPQYTVKERVGTIEIREYPVLIAAEVTVSGERFEAATKGFRLLAAYIFGGNQLGQRISMTAPVIQSRATREVIAMSTPLTQSVAGEDQWLIRFMMPSQYSIDTLPKPNDQRVHLITLAPTRYAVIRFSGIVKESDMTKKLSQLLAFIDSHHLSCSGSPLLARYNPPWTIWFLRRNEIMMPLLAETAI